MNKLGICDVPKPRAGSSVRCMMLWKRSSPFKAGGLDRPDEISAALRAKAHVDIIQHRAIRIKRLSRRTVNNPRNRPGSADGSAKPEGRIRGARPRPATTLRGKRTVLLVGPR